MEASKEKLGCAAWRDSEVWFSSATCHANNARRPRWGNITPLGLPVDPEV